MATADKVKDETKADEPRDVWARYDGHRRIEFTRLELVFEHGDVHKMKESDAQELELLVHDYFTYFASEPRPEPTVLPKLDVKP